MNERQLRRELEALQAARQQLVAELGAEESTHLRATRDAELTARATLTAERHALELELQPLRARDVELTWACFERARAADRKTGPLALALMLLLAVLLPCELGRVLLEHLQLVPHVLLITSLALGALVGGRLLASGRTWRFDPPSLARSSSNAFGGLSRFIGVVVSLSLLVVGPALWIVSVFLPNPMHEPLRLSVVALLGGAFVVSRRHLRDGGRVEDWGPLTVILALLGVEFGVQRLPELARAWLALDHVAGTTALFSLFVPLLGLFWTRRGSHPASHHLAIVSALLASTWTVASIVLHEPVVLGFSGFGCATLGLVLAGAIEDLGARGEARLFNAVAMLGGLAALGS